MRWESYSQFNAEYGFSNRFGYDLTDKQIALIEESLPWGKLLNKAEVGCGKTVLSTVTSLMLDYDITIVTVPPILIPPWVEWLQQVSERVVEYAGNPRVRAKLRLQLREARWIVVSHAIYRDDYNHLLEAIKGRRHEVIVDEAHFIKNHQAVLFKRVKDMVAGNAGCQMLTGTPVSKPLDGYTYIKIKTPGAYRNNTHFESVHVAERDFFKKPIKYANLELLRNNLNLHCISATKEEMFGYAIKAQFPDSHYDLDPEHKALYEQLVNEQLLSFDDGTVIDATTVQKLMHALQQVVVNWDHFGNDPSLKSAAYRMLDQTIEETECATSGKSKLIVWTKYKRTSQKIWDYCKALGIPTVAAFSGSDSRAAADAFMKDDRCRILVAQPQSAGAGLNPQYVCWESLYLEIDTVPIYARQSLGRIDRKGQEHIPRQKIAVARGTVQERLLKNLLENDDLVQEIEPSKKSVRDMLLGGR